jgi:3D (Asp-Asp-Asp) domain-containing protein
MPLTQNTSMLLPRLAIRRRSRIAIIAAGVLAAGSLIDLGSTMFGKGLPAPLLLSVARSSEQPVLSSDLHANSEESDGAAVVYGREFPTSITLRESDSSEISTSESDVQWFNGRPIRPARTISMLVTAYSPDERSCGDSADGITASGYSVWTNGMQLVAADTSVLPFGTLLTIPGYGSDEPVPVLDRGGKIKGNRLDVLFPTHETAIQWGSQRLDVVVWEYADGLPSGFRENHR